MGTVAGSRDGDWKCGGCGNRNYAFRSICNRCKQDRLLMDSQTPADSKWLPRVGDWICPGCSNNNYASRDKCNKCSQPKGPGAVAAQSGQVTPAMALGMSMTMPLGIPNPYGMPWPWGSVSGASTAEEPPARSNFRAGDWMCRCGFHNYSSRLTCRQCQSSMEATGSTATVSPAQNYPFPGHGKRMATEDAGGDWAHKRLNMGGDFSSLHNQYIQQQQLAYAGLSGRGNYYPGQGLIPGMNLGLSGATLQLPTALQMSSGAMQLPMSVLQPSVLGKGAKQWRDGDWMCSGCSNHNFASRNSCNRCGLGKEAGERKSGVA